MAEKPKSVVNPSFRLDIDGKLFKEKATNKDLQETLIFNDLYTRLSIVKGDLPLFPNLGLKQHLYNFGFVDEHEIELNSDDFENDLEDQMGRNCVVDFVTDKTDKSVEITIGVEGLKYPISFKYLHLQNSIRVIHYEFKE